MTPYDPKLVRPARDWCTVLMEERQEKLASGLYLPPSETGAEKVTEGVATIVRVGSGEINEALDLSPRLRVCLRSYFKYANPIENEERWPSGAKKEYFFVSSKDILAVVPDGVSVGVYTRPSQAAVESVSDDGKVRMAR